MLAMDCGVMDAASLVAATHGAAIRLIADARGSHFEGASQAARVLKRDRILTANTAKKLDQLAVAFAITRHITSVSVRNFLSVLKSELQQSSNGDVVKGSETPIQTAANSEVGNSETASDDYTRASGSLPSVSGCDGAPTLRAHSAISDLFGPKPRQSSLEEFGFTMAVRQFSIGCSEDDHFNKEVSTQTDEGIQEAPSLVYTPCACGGQPILPASRENKTTAAEETGARVAEAQSQPSGPVARELREQLAHCERVVAQVPQTSPASQGSSLATASHAHEASIATADAAAEDRGDSVGNAASSPRSCSSAENTAAEGEIREIIAEAIGIVRGSITSLKSDLIAQVKAESDAETPEKWYRAHKKVSVTRKRLQSLLDDESKLLAELAEATT